MADYNQQLGYPNNINMSGYPNNIGNVPPRDNNLMMNNPYNTYMRNTNQPSQNNNMFNQFLKCRPVSSKEEAKAAQIDLDGSLWVFTDVGNEKIYTKRINNDGTASFVTYEKVEDEIPQQMSGDYVTREEFNKVIQTLIAAMQPVNAQDSAAAQNKNENQKEQQPSLVSF